MQEELIKLLPINTDRLVLKKTTVDDIDLILKLDKQEVTQKYLGGIKNKTKEERILFLEKKENSNKSLTVYLDNIAIGFVELKINNKEAEISYIIDIDYTKMGFCTEVIKKLVYVSFNNLNINRLIADSKIDNIASRKVLEKNNFKEFKIIEDFIYYELKKEV